MNQASRGLAQDAAAEQPTRERASFRWLHHDAGTGSLGGFCRFCSSLTGWRAVGPAKTSVS
jgi:hypothetical protein